MEWLEIIKWWIVLEVIGFAALPVTALIFKNLKSKGVFLTKILGLLCITYLSWVLAHLGLHYSTVIAYASLFILFVTSLVILIFKKHFIDRSEIIRSEVLFTAAFLFIVILRAFSPDIYWTGGEKFMDMSFINMILRSSSFPPTDPWMSGEPMQYYYFGYLLIANLIKLSYVPTAIGFNLGVATMFALSATAAYGLGTDLTGNRKFGVIVMAFVVIFGNIAGFIQLLVILFVPGYYHIFNVPDTDLLTRLSTYDYWSTSRVIPNTINEFPYFSFIHGDLHAHMISIAFQLLMIALLLSLLRSGKEYNIPILAAVSLVLGFMFPLNTWDYPTYAIFFLIVLPVWRFRVSTKYDNAHSIKNRILNFDRNELIKTAGAGFMVCILSVLLYLPYHLASTESHSLKLVTYGQTQLMFYLGVYGIMLFFIMVYAIISFINSYDPNMKTVLAGLFIAVIAAYFTQIDILIIILPLIVMSVHSIIKEEVPTIQFVHLLILVGALLSLFCEIFYIQDFMGMIYSQNIRLNTVFKIYLQNWIIWALAAGMSCYLLWNKCGPFGKPNKGFAVISVFLILTALSYPVLATQSRSNNFKGSPTLDGSAYFKKQYPNEHSAVIWLNNLSQTPVVLQSPGYSYRLNIYVTAFTGLPTVIGWGGHEKTWRNNNSDITERWKEAQQVYTSTNIDTVNHILDRYQVDYIYVGGVEEECYGGYNARKVFEKNPDRFELVYFNPDVHIFKVVRQ